jgi:hypothetical protein
MVMRSVCLKILCHFWVKQSRFSQKHLIFYTPPKTLNIYCSPTIQMGNVALPPEKNKVKYLGMHLDEG